MKVVSKTIYGDEIIMLEPRDIDKGRPCIKCKDRTNQKILRVFLAPIEKIDVTDPDKGWFYEAKCLVCGNKNYISGFGLEPEKVGMFSFKYEILK